MGRMDKEQAELKTFNNYTIIMANNVAHFDLIQQAALGFQAFQNLENLISNIVKENLHISCLVSF